MAPRKDSEVPPRPLALPCPVPGPWLKLLAEVGVVGVAACGQGPRRTSRPPSPPHSQHHKAAPPVGARGVATRRGGGPGAPGVTRPRGEASPRSGSGPRGRRVARPGGRNLSLWGGPCPWRAGLPTRSKSRGLVSLWPQGDPPARTPQNSGGPRGSTRGARDRGCLQPCPLGPGPFRPGA